MARSKPVVLFEKAGFLGSRRVKLSRVARAGDLVNVKDDEKPRVVDGEVFRLDVGEWRKVLLTKPELEDAADEFFRLHESGDALSEIVLVVDGGTFGKRDLEIEAPFFARVAEVLAPYRRAPLAAVGAYR